MKKIIIFGCGEGSQELVNVLIKDINGKSAQWQILGFIDRDLSKKGKKYYGVPVIGDKYEDSQSDVYAVCGIMDNQLRAKIVANEIRQQGLKLATLIHPTIMLPEGFQFAEGAMIMPGVRVSYDVRIGESVFIDYNCVLGHHLHIGDYSFLGPSVTIPGKCKIGKSCLIGAGANFVHGVSVGDDVTIGAGTTVFDNVEDGMSVIDIPRKMISSKKKKVEV